MPTPNEASTTDVPKLDIKNLHVTYRSRTGDDVEAVRDVNLQIANKPGVGEAYCRGTFPSPLPRPSLVSLPPPRVGRAIWRA